LPLVPRRLRGTRAGPSLDGGLLLLRLVVARCPSNSLTRSSSAAICPVNAAMASCAVANSARNAAMVSSAFIALLYQDESCPS